MHLILLVILPSLLQNTLHAAVGSPTEDSLGASQTPLGVPGTEGVQRTSPQVNDCVHDCRGMMQTDPWPGERQRFFRYDRRYSSPIA